MPKYEEFEEEKFSDEEESSYDDSDDEDMDLAEKAFLRGYDEADIIEEEDDWEFDE